MVADVMTAVSDLFERVMISRSGSNDYAVFDADALWNNDVADAVMARITKDYPHEYRLDIERYHSLVTSGDICAAHELRARIFQGWAIDDVERLVVKTFRSKGKAIGTEGSGIALNENIILLMRRARVCRVSVYVMGDFPEPILNGVLNHWGIADVFDGVIGVRNKVVRGVITGNLGRPAPICREKAACIRKFIHPTVPPLLVVGNGANDEKMLRMGICRAVVNRNSTFTEKARKLGWAILEP